jgi:virginiamycin B lyase
VRQARTSGALRHLAVAFAMAVAALALASAPSRAATPTVTMFNSGIPNPAKLVGITAGPDGKVWFADNFNQALGAVTLSSGSTNEIALPADRFPIGLTSGPNGRLYSFDGISGIAWSFVR